MVLVTLRERPMIGTTVPFTEATRQQESWWEFSPDRDYVYDATNPSNKWPLVHIYLSDHKMLQAAEAEKVKDPSWWPVIVMICYYVAFFSATSFVPEWNAWSKRISMLTSLLWVVPGAVLLIVVAIESLFFHPRRLRAHTAYVAEAYVRAGLTQKDVDYVFLDGNVDPDELEPNTVFYLPDQKSK